MGPHPLLYFGLMVTGALFLVVILGGMFLWSLTWVAGTKRRTPQEAIDPDASWRVLRTYTTPEQAHLDRAMLAGYGVPVRLANEHTVGTDWLYGVAVGVDLRVPEDQLESAELLLRDAQSGDASVDIEAEDLYETNENPRCHRCGSAEVYRVRPGAGWALAAVVLLGLPLLRGARHRCDDCGSRQPLSDD